MNLLQRKRVANALLSPSTQQQAMLDNAPRGSVGAPGGLLGPAPQPKPKNYLSGLLGAASFAPGIGDTMGLINDARMYAMDPSSRTLPNFGLTALGALPFVPALATVFHGSPHKFDAFDLSKIGTGEGAQAYGHGLYFAESPGVAATYRDMRKDSAIATNPKEVAGRLFDALEKQSAVPGKVGVGPNRSMVDRDTFVNGMASGLSDFNWWNFPASARDEAEKAFSGSLYTVDLPDEAIAKMLDWDKPLSEQAPEVRAYAERLGLGGAIGLQDGMSLAGGGVLRVVDDPDFGAKYFMEIDGKRFRLSPSDVQNLVGSGQEGKSVYQALQTKLGNAPAVSNALKDAGIPGIRYLDGGSRGSGKGTSNFVVFDDKLPKILKRE